MMSAVQKPGFYRFLKAQKPGFSKFLESVRSKNKERGPGGPRFTSIKEIKNAGQAARVQVF